MSFKVIQAAYLPLEYHELGIKSTIVSANGTPVIWAPCVYETQTANDMPLSPLQVPNHYSGQALGYRAPLKTHKCRPDQEIVSNRYFYS